VDPLAGSYYVEALTDRIEAAARALIEEVDALGGAARAIEQGFFQRRIGESAWALQQAQEAGHVAVIGVNRFATDEPPSRLMVPDFAELEAAQRNRVAEARSRREAGAADAAIAGVEDAARSREPLMPRIIEAVRARATIGEISDALRRVWGTYRA
jgi:methylmalonyl-CoA mutase N-terminal domain/subunit